VLHALPISLPCVQLKDRKINNFFTAHIYKTTRPHTIVDRNLNIL
jgi:hypothetical protein